MGETHALNTHMHAQYAKCSQVPRLFVALSTLRIAATFLPAVTNTYFVVSAEYMLSLAYTVSCTTRPICLCVGSLGGDAATVYVWDTNSSNLVKGFAKVHHAPINQVARSPYHARQTSEACQTINVAPRRLKTP